MGIAERRHHRERIKRNRRHYWGRDLRQDPKHHDMAVDTPKPCSCWMCGHQRQLFGPTIQERRLMGGAYRRANNVDVEEM